MNFLRQCQRSFSTSIVCKQAKPFEEIPGPRRFPLIGNLHYYKLGIFKLSEYHEVLHRLHDTYGSLVRQDLGSDSIIHVFDPEDVKIVHSSSGKTPMIQPLQPAAKQYRHKRNLALGLGNMNGEEWYRLRSAVQQMMMRPKEVQYYLPFIDQIAQELVCKIKEIRTETGEVKDLRVLIAKWNLESSGMICFEKKLGCLHGNETMAEKLIQANVDIFRLSADLKFSFGLHKFIQTPKWQKFEAAEDFFFGTASQFIDETIDEIRTITTKSELSRKQFNFMGYLLGQTELSQQDVQIITFSLFADGLSTTSPALMFNLYNLAKYPRVQEIAYDEIQRHICGLETLTVDLLNNLKYLKAIVKETFRVLPGGTEVSRITSTDLILNNYKIPQGTHVDLNQFVNFKSPKYFPNPENFEPERWIRGSGDGADAHPYLMTPFGHGTRMCAGRRFAEQDLYTSLIRLIENFKIELVESDTQMSQIYSTLLFPKYPLRLKFISRN